MSRTRNPLAALEQVGPGTAVALAVLLLPLFASTTTAAGLFPPPFRELSSGPFGPFAVRETFAAPSEKELHRKIQELQLENQLLSPVPTLHGVNWHKEAVLLLSLGRLTSGGYRIDCVKTRVVGSRLKVTAIVRLVPQTHTITAPFQILAIGQEGWNWHSVDCSYIFEFDESAPIAGKQSGRPIPAGPANSWGELKDGYR